MASNENGNGPSEIDLPRRALLQRLAAGASLAAVAGSPALAQNAPAPADAAARRPEPDPDETTAKFIALTKELSNWGRWGADDQMGTVNLITPAKRKAALALVREGVPVSMERDIDLKKSADNATPVVLTVTRAGKGQPPNKFKQGGTADAQLLNYHNFVQTHMNALAHFMYDQKMYNGKSQDLVTLEEGATVNNIMAFKSGVCTRGVLYDIPRHRNVDWLEPGELVYPDELEAWEKKSGAKVGKGDVFMVRTGRSLRREKLGPWNLNLGIAGLHMDCAKWFHERDVAICGSDGDLDARPSKVTGIGAPLHTLCLAIMGTPLFDEMDLELVASEAAKRKRWEYAVLAAPMAMPGGTGSIINPIAMF